MDFLSHYSKHLGFMYSLVPINHGYKNRLRTLTKREQLQLTTIKNEKRRKEWLAGRFAAKTACLQEKKWKNISVLNKASGKPFFYEEPETCLTLSHSGAYAIALVSSREIGVDLELIEKRPESFNRYFLTKEERYSLEGLNEVESQTAVTAFWTRKEAVSKFLGMGGNLSFKEINTTDCIIRLPEYSMKDICLYSGTIDNYVISIAMENQRG